MGGKGIKTRSLRTVIIIIILVAVISCVAMNYTRDSHSNMHDYIVSYGADYSDHVAFTADSKIVDASVVYYVDDKSVITVTNGNAVRKYSNGVTEVYGRCKVMFN